MEQPTATGTASGSSASPASAAVGGLVLAVIGGIFLAQAGGGDRELFLTLGFALSAAGLLGIIVGGVAIGIRLARD